MSALRSLFVPTLKRWDFWLTAFLYAFFLASPLSSEYHNGSDITVLYFINRTYRATDASSILLLVALFPVIRGLYHQLNQTYLPLWLVRRSSWSCLVLFVLNAILIVGCVVGLGNALAMSFIAQYTPFVPNNQQILNILISQYPGVELLNSPWAGAYYLIPFFIQWTTSVCALMLVMCMAMVVNNALFLNISPLLVYCLWRMTPNWYLVNPLAILSPEAIRLRSLVGDQWLSILGWQVVFVGTFVGLCFLLLHVLLKYRLAGRYQLVF